MLDAVPSPRAGRPLNFRAMTNTDTPVASAFNDAYVDEAYERFQQDPTSVDASWHQLFRFAQRLTDASGDGGMGAGSAVADLAVLRSVAGAAGLVAAIRQHGHMAVAIDPLGSPPPGAAELAPEFHGVSEAVLAGVPARALGFAHSGSAADAVRRLRAAYSSNLGIEFEHLRSEEERRWFRDTLEGDGFQRSLTADEKVALLDRLAEVDGLETFLELAYKGTKRFSIEGTDALVPMLDAAIAEASKHGARTVAISMAHRGRLNVLAHILDKPYATIFEEFEEKHAQASAGSGTGDVKYHLGARGKRTLADGSRCEVLLVPNPSHLEVVNPILNGVARALQRTGEGAAVAFDEASVVPVCIHGDAAFPGEGVVAETFNMSRLRGYRVGGVLHLIVNNQVGFTTDPHDARSTHYASDLAKGFEVPVIHVNGDDAEGCVVAVRLAVAYRAKFKKDVVVDLVGYRRHGHNETDEPAITQPLLYTQVRPHPRPVDVWGARIARDGATPEDRSVAAKKSVRERLAKLHDEFRAGTGSSGGLDEDRAVGSSAPAESATAVSEDLLRTLNEQLTRLPDGFTAQRSPAAGLAKRKASIAEAGGIEMGHAEALALGSLLMEGVGVRLTGQDAERGTFNQRQAVLHDVNSGMEHVPLKALEGARALCEIYNSPLSETAVMGFDYGFSTIARDALTLWEAQYGDFVNVAQPIIDQFLAADRVKWGQDSGLVLLLPHGYEGQGPEHSSARLERFLLLCAEDNLSVTYPTTAAQYFHLLRRQARCQPRRPLVVMTGKSLLRLAAGTSRLTDLAAGTFTPLIDDTAAQPAAVQRVIFCSGKMFYHLQDARGDAPVAIVRVEELYPWPGAQIAAALARYPTDAAIVWAQEEPRNMGAWTHAWPLLRAAAGEREIEYVGRPERASPAEGFKSAHDVEQARIVGEAVNGSAGGKSAKAPVSPPPPRKKKARQGTR